MFRASDFKSELMELVTNCINQGGFKNDSDAAKKLDSCKAVISKVRAGRTGNCSTSKLVYMLHKMGYKVEIKLTKI